MRLRLGIALLGVLAVWGGIGWLGWQRLNARRAVEATAEAAASARASPTATVAARPSGDGSSTTPRVYAGVLDDLTPTPRPTARAATGLAARPSAPPAKPSRPPRKHRDRAKPTSAAPVAQLLAPTWLPIQPPGATGPAASPVPPAPTPRSRPPVQLPIPATRPQPSPSPLLVGLPTAPPLPVPKFTPTPGPASGPGGKDRHTRTDHGSSRRLRETAKGLALLVPKKFETADEFAQAMTKIEGLLGPVLTPEQLTKFRSGVPKPTELAAVDAKRLPHDLLQAKQRLLDQFGRLFKSEYGLSEQQLNALAAAVQAAAPDPLKR